MIDDPLEMHDMLSQRYWQALDTLVATCRLVIDRPAGSTHPRYPDFIYPLDYGYLDGSLAGDGQGIDCWVGSIPDKTITAVIFTIDLVKRDMEAKLLLGCTPLETQELLQVHNTGPQSGILLTRPPAI